MLHVIFISRSLHLKLPKSTQKRKKYIYILLSLFIIELFTMHYNSITQEKQKLIDMIRVALIRACALKLTHSVHLGPLRNHEEPVG